MTQPRAAIVFNASTGSDTAASGLGPATAVGGAARAHTNGASSTTITLNAATDLSGVQAGDIVWLKTASGRQFSVIVSVNDGADTFVVDDAFNIAAGSPVDCWIGGKRATWADADSLTLFTATGAKLGWEIQTETDQTITAAIVLVMAQTETVFITGDSPGTRRVITQSSNLSHFTTGTGGAGSVEFRNLKFVNTNGTKTAANWWTSGSNVASRLRARNCVFGDATNKLNALASNTNGQISLWLEGCVGEYWLSVGIGTFITGGIIWIDGCRFTDNDSSVVSDPTSGGNAIWHIANSLFARNGATPLRFITGNKATQTFSIEGNTFDGNTGDAIEGLSSMFWRARIANNIFSNHTDGCTGALNMSSGTLTALWGQIDHNVFFNNTAHRNNVPAGDNDQDGVDPDYVNAAAGDFTPQEATLEGTAFPTSIP